MRFPPKKTTGELGDRGRGTQGAAYFKVNAAGKRIGKRVGGESREHSSFGIPYTPKNKKAKQRNKEPMGNAPLEGAKKKGRRRTESERTRTAEQTRWLEP